MKRSSSSAHGVFLPPTPSWRSRLATPDPQRVRSSMQPDTILPTALQLTILVMVVTGWRLASSSRSPSSSWTDTMPAMRAFARCAVTLLFALSAAPRPVTAQTAGEEIASVIDDFHTALSAGDSTAALALLADDVVILEGGAVEDKDRYRSGHLAGDMRFAQAVPADRGQVSVTRVGDVAWAWSTSTRQGRTDEREVSSRGAELMVLRRDAEGWRITAIHWSSRSR